MQVHVLLYDAGKDSEGIHSLELSGKTVVLMFENLDDALRYAGLLEAQDFPVPSVEVIDRMEIEEFCIQAGYEVRFVESGFVPKTDEDRLLLSPPVSNKDVSNWDKQSYDNLNNENVDQADLDSKNLEDIKKRLEGLL